MHQSLIVCSYFFLCYLTVISRVFLWLSKWWWLSNDDIKQIWYFIVKKKIIHGRVETWNFASTRYLTIDRSKRVKYQVYHVNAFLKKLTLFMVIKESMLSFTHGVKLSDWCLSSWLVTSNRCEKLSQFFHVWRYIFVRNPHIGLLFLSWGNFSLTTTGLSNFTFNFCDMTWHAVKVTVVLYIFAICGK